MVFIRARISCFRCLKSVDKAETRFFDTVNNERRYECFPCYQKTKNGFLHNQESATKRELYCEHCKYKFMSRKPVCPYCSSDESVVLANFSVSELL